MQASKGGKQSTDNLNTAVRSMNHNNDQYGMITLRVLQWQHTLAVTNSTLIRFKAHLEGNHAWYGNSQLFSASEDMGLGEETTTTLLNQQHSKYLSLYPQISVVITLFKETSLQQKETITENCKQSKCPLTEPKAQGSLLKKGWKDLKRQKINEFVVRLLSPRNVRNHTHKVLPTWLPKHQLNKDINRQTREGKTYTNNYRQLKNAKSQRNNLPQQRAHQQVF